MKRIHDHIYEWINPHLHQNTKQRLGDVLNAFHTIAIFSLPLFILFYPRNDTLFYLVGLLVSVTIACNILESGCFLLRLERKLLADKQHIGFYQPAVNQFDIPVNALSLQSTSLFFFASIVYLYMMRLIDMKHYRGQAIVYATMCGIMWCYSLWYIRHPTIQLLSP